MRKEIKIWIGFMTVSLFLIMDICGTMAQVNIEFTYNMLKPPNTYKSKQNPFYWGNRSNAGSKAWQQDVHYSINAELDTANNQIKGTEKLTYWNNSPDTLFAVYFHLPPNAFTKDSAYDKWMQHVNSEARQKPEQDLQHNHTSSGNKNGMDLTGVSIVTGKSFVRTKYSISPLDQTLMKVELAAPLMPNEFIVFELDFATLVNPHFPNADNAKLYKCGNWFPQIAVYSPDKKWQTQSFMNDRMGLNFGTFDVELKVPENYAVEAGGFLVEPKVNKKKSKNNTQESGAKKWFFHNENINNFAFVAGDGFGRLEKKVGSTKLIAFTHQSQIDSKEALADWKETLNIAGECVLLLEKVLGKLPFHKVVLADVADSKTYPMLCLISGHSKNNKALIVNTLCKMWLQESLGFRSSYDPILGEGLTQYLTHKVLAIMETNATKNANTDSDSADYLNNESLNAKELKKALFERVKQDANENAFTNVFSPIFFNKNPSYSEWQTHDKVTAFYYALEDNIGDAKTLKIIQQFLLDWRFAHPDSDDFAATLNDVLDSDFSCFLNQWKLSFVAPNFRVQGVTAYEDKTDTYWVHLEQNSYTNASVDLKIIAKNDKEYLFHIPSCTDANITGKNLLPQWMPYQSNYSFVAEIPSGIRRVEIDPDGWSLDANWEDDFWEE